MVVDESAFARGMVRTYLEMVGHRVVEAAGVREALEKLERHPVDVLLASLDLPGREVPLLLESIRRLPAGPPLLALTSGAEGGARPGGREGGFDDYQSKFDREGMLRSIERLAAAVRTAETPAPEAASSGGGWRPGGTS